MVGEDVRRNPSRVFNGRYALSSCSSSSSSSSSYLSFSPPTDNGGECGLDGMELAAARALACISKEALRKGGGKRLKRFKNRSPVRDWDVASVPEDNNANRDSEDDKIKVEQITEILPPSSNCSTNSHSSSGPKRRPNLTEAEREARRMRRVLANRESARQTIRRRQALRDGLIKKVSDLSLANQNMKLEKRQITKEYLSLRNKNKQLKTELAMTIACNIMGAEPPSPPPQTSSSPTETSFLSNLNPTFLLSICPPWPYDKPTEPQVPSSRFSSLLDQTSVPHHLISRKSKDEEINILAPCSKPTLAPSKDEAMKVEKSCKLDIDLNYSSAIPEPSDDTSNHCSSDEFVVEQTAKFLEAKAAASARRRRKEILKLKHLCGRPMDLDI
ncbi:uncharacterized protein LOC110019863 isoform X2 [Phalaenopsis equestris]|uniref:uncharacterized protein LOC110019863 isoform X2 n=1 Tax=Phalaenopsis equestris TaxID=78828 RepID=UPI0009E333C6|nr:uncharacterized protein LOC110019863 isoform X2 [Phalaenopsis equestris]